MPSTVILDVNETLSDLTPVADALAALGLPREAATTWLAATLRDGFALSLTTGARPFAEVAEQALTGLLAAEPNLRGPVQDGVDQVMAVFAALPVHPDVIDGLRALALAGHHLVTLSNGSSEYARDLLERAGAADAIEAFLSVEAVDAWKPHRSTYEHALARLSVTAADAALVAVHPWDLHGARAAGLVTVHLDRDGAPWPSVLTPPDHCVRTLTELELP